MVKNPRPPQPGSQEPPESPEDPLDLLRALAQRRAPGEPVPAARDGHDAGDPDPKLESLRALAANLDRQLRGSSPAESPGPPLLATHPASPPPPTRPAPQGSMQGGARSEWQAFRDGLPSARALVPHIGVTQIVFVAIAVAVLAAAAIGTFVRHRGETSVAITGPVMPPSDQLTAPPPTMQEPPPPDLAAVKKEMSDCDNAAAHEPDSLYFLILPLTAPKPDSDWRPVALQTIGDAYMLIGANDALDGLRQGRLKVRPGRYTFSVLDPQSGMTYSWTSATGMSRLSRKQTGNATTLKLGFDFSASQTGAQWSAAFKHDRGTCYWVVPVVREGT